MKSVAYYSALVCLATFSFVVSSLTNDSLEETERTVTYGEFCKPTGPFCNERKDLECEDGKCTCKNNSDSEEKLVYVEDDEGCQPISKFSDNWACNYDEQCTHSNFGNNSFCLKYHSSKGSCSCRPSGDPCADSSKRSGMSPHTGVRPCHTNLDCTNTILGELSRCNSQENNCECFDTEGRGRPVIAGFDNVCYFQKRIDQSCRNDKECNATISGEAVCLGSDGVKAGVCKCARGYQFVKSFNECLKLGKINSSCKSSLQCHNLGQLAYCKEETKKCECWDVPGSGQKNTKFYRGMCHYSSRENETCNDRLECILGFHPNAECWVHDSFNNEKVCQCSEGKLCSNANVPINDSSLLALVISGFITFAFWQ